MTARIVPLDFYVYTHHKATTGEIFYVGKGYGPKRARNTGARSIWWKHTVAKHGRIVKIVQDGLQEWAAFELECDLIALYGRRDQGLGPLVNTTDGGEGSRGTLRDPVSSETRDKIRKSLTGRRLTPEHRAVRRGWKLSEETRAKVAAAVTGRRHTTEARANMRVAQTEAKGRPVVCNGVLLFSSTQEAGRWVQQKRGGKDPRSLIRRCAEGVRKSAYGYTWAYATPPSLWYA